MMQKLTHELLHKAIEVDQCILVKLDGLREDPFNRDLIEEIERDVIRQADLIKRAQREWNEFGYLSSLVRGQRSGPRLVSKKRTRAKELAPTSGTRTTLPDSFHFGYSSFAC